MTHSVGNRTIALVIVAFAAFGCERKDNSSRAKPDDNPRQPRPTLDAAAANAAADASVATPPPIKPPPTRRVYTSALKSATDFLAYSKQVGGERFSKFVIDTKTDKLYFFDVNVYTVHREFVFAQLYRTKMTKDKERKFRRNYGRKKPDFILGYLVHHLGPDIWTMAFWSGDLIRPPDIQRAYRLLKASFYAGARVKYRPDSHMQEYVAKKLSGVPLITNDKIYKNAVYQVFNPGKAVGVLRFVKAGAKYEDLTFKRDEIVVLPETLPDITPVSGIISNTFSTPLAHVSLRARAWGIPNIGFKKATSKYRALAGKTVYFEAGAVKHTLRKATAAEIAAWKDRRAKAKRVVVPKADLKTRDLRPLTKLRSRDVVAYGAKTANLGEVARAKIAKASVPAGFGIPIHYYAAHMKAAKLDARAVALLEDKRFRADARYRKQKLAELRAAIVKAPMELAFQVAVVAEVSKLAEDKGVFVRSSTNAEDLPGFNGAGLYDTVPNVRGEKKLVRAIKQVWASVWNLRAYEEREFFGIDHTKVYGAVLVQVAVNPTAAGVLVTPKQSLPKLRRVYIINAKSGLGLRVVGGKKSPEIVHYTHVNRGLRILSRSDEKTKLVFDSVGGVKEVPIKNPGKPVLTDPRSRKLGGVAHAIVKLFPKVRQLDIEWLFVEDELHIVQARPYVGGQ